MNRDVRDVVDAAVGRGWEIVREGPHMQMRHPNGALTHVSSTPSDRRAASRIDTTFRRLERLGAQHARRGKGN